MKKCSSCNENKLLIDFSKSSKSGDGFCPYCKVCAKIKVAEWIKNNPKRRAVNQRNHYLKYKKEIGMKKKTRLYGLSEKDYIGLISKQKNKCAICNKSFSKTRPVVDHCHKTGKIRGILCICCNSRLERLHSNDIRWIMKAQEYMKT